jgi:hypothetical protein
VIGLVLRCGHFLRNPSVWHDEAALLINVISLDYRELLGSLHFAEAAPPLFLWLERTMGLLLGEDIVVYRLVPFLAGCLSLVLFVPVARRYLEPAAVPWAIFLLACSETLAWHTVEAKPYAVEVLAAVVLLLIFGSCLPLPLKPGLSDPGAKPTALGGLGHAKPGPWHPIPKSSVAGSLLIWSLLAPLITWLCYPGCFLLGGILLAFLPAVWRDRRWSTMLAYLVLVLSVGGSFTLLVLGPVRAQQNDLMLADWLDKFPRWDDPWTVPGWMVVSTAELFRYVCKPLGQFLAPLAVVGVWAIRQGTATHPSCKNAVLTVLIVPILLALVAACLGEYPYGGARVMAYAAPAVVLLVAAGVPPGLAWLRARSRFAWACFLILLFAPLGGSIYRAAVPWERADAAGAADHVLGNCLAADAVIGNDWEHVWYFRHLGDRFRLAFGTPTTAGWHLEPTESGGWRLLGNRPSPTGRRIWIVAKSPTAEGRQAYLDALPAGWRIIERQEFVRVTVVLVETDGSP